VDGGVPQWPGKRERGSEQAFHLLQPLEQPKPGVSEASKEMEGEVNSPFSSYIREQCRTHVEITDYGSVDL